MSNTMSKSEMRAEILALLDAVDKLPENVKVTGFMKMGACRTTILADSSMERLADFCPELESVKSWYHYGEERTSGILSGVEITGPARWAEGGDTHA